MLTLGEIAAATSGTLVLESRRSITSVSIDTRTAQPGFLFVALPGTRTDGHEFVRESAAVGAAAALVTRSRWSESSMRGLEIGIIVVEDALKALQDLAAHQLAKFQDLFRIGITGSNGKTTTKELIGSILSRHASTVMSEGNLNSEIGLPLSVFKVEPNHRFAIFEMAMNRAGEMDILAEIVRPHAALITNIGTAHIEQLKSKRAIAAEKKKIFKLFDGKQEAYLHEEDAFFDYLKKDVRGEVIPFGEKSTKGYTGRSDLGLEGTAIHWEGLQVRFPLFGTHNLTNALGAITLATHQGVSRDAVKSGLEAVVPLFGRSQIIKGCITLIQDCYNANPDSMASVLAFFRCLAWTGRKVLVLGSMLELGEMSDQAHSELVRLALTSKADRVFFFGKEMQMAYAEIKGPGSESHSAWTDDFDTLLSKVKENVRAGDIVLLKGSRGVQLERLIDPLLKSVA